MEKSRARACPANRPSFLTLSRSSSSLRSRGLMAARPFLDLTAKFRGPSIRRERLSLKIPLPKPCAATPICNTRSTNLTTSRTSISPASPISMAAPATGFTARLTGGDNNQFYDVQTGLLAGYRFQADDKSAAVSTLVFQDYKNFGGPLVATKLTSRTGDLVRTFTFTSVS